MSDVLKKDLRELIVELIQNLDSEKLDKRIDSYTDYKSRFVVLKPSVKVDVELTDGRVIKIDITDYFEGVIK